MLRSMFPIVLMAAFALSAANTTYHYADNLTIVRGRHLIKTGGQFLRQQLNTFYAGNNGRTGYISFSGRFSAANAAAPIDPPTRPTPVVRTLTLSATDAGAEVAATGQNLSKEFVASVYLTKGDDTFELVVTSQTHEKITAKLPANLKSGRYGLMVLTRGDVPRFIEEPVFLILE